MIWTTYSDHAWGLADLKLVFSAGLDEEVDSITVQVIGCHITNKETCNNNQQHHTTKLVAAKSEGPCVS